MQQCEISYQYSEDGEAADITVTLAGYAPETLPAVENKTGLLG